MYLKSYNYGLFKFEFVRETSEYYYYKNVEDSSSEETIFFKDANILQPKIFMYGYSTLLTKDFILDTEKIYTINDCKKIV